MVTLESQTTTFFAGDLLQHLTTAVLVLDANLRVVYCNNAACILVGQNEKRLLSLSIKSVFRHLSIATEQFLQTLEQQADFNDSEVQAVLVDSRTVLLELKCAALVQNHQTYALIEAKQVDEQKRIIQESQHENQHQIARDLVRGLAHEIKNPLGGIRGAAQLLQKQLPDDHLQEFTSVIVEQSDRLRKLVDRLLGPNKPPQLFPVNIHQVIDKTLRLIQFEQHLCVRLDYDPSIPEINLDAELIQQALINIVRNAVQAMSEQQQPPEITVATRVKPRQLINHQFYKLCLEIKIIDNGPGVPSNLMDTIFFPFVSGSQSGSGLGLSISQTLINQHGGRVDCDSWPGHTEFTLLLPFKEY